MGQPNSEAVEFSRVVTIEQVGEAGFDLNLSATPAECAALARRFDLIALEGLTAEARLRRVRGGTLVRLSATLSADVVQACVVTLEPVRSRVQDSFSLSYAPDAGLPVREIVVSVNDEEEGKTLDNGAIDVGEAVAQQLSLALDPYPRAAGADPSQFTGDDPIEDEKAQAQPFAVLAALKERRGS